MNDQEDRKQNRRESITKKTKQKSPDRLERKNIKHQKYDLKHKRDDMEQEELWEEWQDYY